MGKPSGLGIPAWQEPFACIDQHQEFMEQYDCQLR
ncbi:Uncharacterised protein [Serratia liquefaciens]|jgi:hypothetical protein|nr:Uncharacterised protein [Serratia liquefaciens]CAI1099599.1 Uncharacterised protein [Serratia liquefaciens]CAI1155981.1 Uncharacterised protein [Serratia liquefaciens]CAI1174343.1 Uncharacterised protein [Serratia liquefaciens]CAI1908086.1 Uncharacterised protein [Serratia liquefaciens]